MINVLIVDDSKIARNKLKDTLAELGNYFNVVCEAEDGKDGLEKFTQNKIDLVLTDIEMPNMNGIDMAQAIREIDQNVEILVVSSVDIENVKQIFKQQHIKTITKPIKLQQFKSVLSHLLRKGED